VDAEGAVGFIDESGRPCVGLGTGPTLLAAQHAFEILSGRFSKATQSIIDEGLI